MAENKEDKSEERRTGPEDRRKDEDRRGEGRVVTEDESRRKNPNRRDK